MKELGNMNNGDVIQEIVVDVTPKGVFLVGFGADGKIDRRQGQPMRFKHFLAAVDRAELWAKMHRTAEQKYFPDRKREVKVIFTDAFWAEVEAIKARLDAQAAGEVKP